MDYQKLLSALPQAGAAYGNASSNGQPMSVGTWSVNAVPDFKRETTNFQAALYKDGVSGQYRVGFAGSNDSQDWSRTNLNLATGRWDASATDSIRFMGAALKEVRAQIIQTEGDLGANTSLPRLLQYIDTTGHSQGGALSELSRAFWGNRATNIDGPGIGKLLSRPEFATLKTEMQKDFPDLLDTPYAANDGGMQIFAFTKIGLTGDHFGAPVQATIDAKVVDFLTGAPPAGSMAIGQGALIGLQAAWADRMEAIEAIARAGTGAASPVNGLPNPATAPTLPAIDPNAANADMDALNTSGGDNVSTGGSNALPAIVFNPATALADYRGDNAYVIQANDTVTLIAAKLGMSESDLKTYLKAQYGDSADLNSIVAGRSLPIPADKLAAYKGASINGLDLPSSTPPAPASHDPTDPSSIDAVNGSDHQSDNYLNVIDIPAPALANHFAGGNAGGAYGAGQLMGFDVLPFNTSSSFLTNADGDIVGEINILPNGYQQIKNLYGEAVYVSDRDGSRGDTLSQAQYEQASAQPLTPETGSVLDDSQYRQAAGAVGLMNSIIGLQSWSDMGGLQRLAAVTSIYNAVDSLSGGNALPGELGAAAGTLGLLSALDQGNMGGALYSGLSLVENLTFDAATKMGFVTETFGGNFLPGLGLVLALDSGDPVSILAAAANFIPVYGQIISVVITLLGSLFADDDQPMLEGRAHAEWDGAGNTIVLTDQDSEGGGATATNWMSSLVTGLQAQLANTKDANGGNYALIPNLLPAIGYQYDPDGFNLANGAKGFLYLQWTDEQGNSQTRYYDGQGSRGDDSGETLAGDFMKRAQGAIAPAWQVQTVLAHWQQGQGINLPDAQSGLPQEQSDDIHQNLQALSLSLPQLPPLQNALIDIDGDGYLEQTQWLATHQQVLAIDSNGDGQIGAGELLSLSGKALNSLSWLDANHDNILNASDPAFAALRLWVDLNSDGQSNGETQTLSQAGITAIDFGANPPAVVRTDGSRTTLTAQTLSGEILGVSYQSVTGGVLQLDEQKNAAAIATLHAVNTREFDGQAARIRGGDVDTDGADGVMVTVNIYASNKALAHAGRARVAMNSGADAMSVEVSSLRHIHQSQMPRSCACRANRRVKGKRVRHPVLHAGHKHMQILFKDLHREPGSSLYSRATC